MTSGPGPREDDEFRWRFWDLFLRTGTAELCDAEIPGVNLVPDYPARALGSARLAIGPVLRLGLAKAGENGPTPMDMISRHVAPGAVIAISSEGSEVAVMGGRLAAQAIVKGAAAVVTDGRLRDANELGRLPIAAWANARTPTGGTEPGTYRVLSGPSKLFGIEWADGDWYAQDEDGALRISAAAATEVVATFGRAFRR